MQPLPLLLSCQTRLQTLPVVALFDKLSPRLLAGRARFAAVSVGVWRHSCTFGDLKEVVPTHTAASGSFFWVFLFGSL